MSDFDLKTDEEKAEALKEWWRANGLSIVAGVALTFAGMFGWNYWKESQITASEGASKIFSQLNKPDADASKVVEELKNQYGSSVYTSLAELAAAKQNCDKDQLDACISSLKAAGNSPQAAVANLATVRLARVYVSSGKLDEAQKLLGTTLPKAFDSLVNELKGDIFVAKKDFDKAREAYEKAIQSAGSQDTRLIQMKRDDLGDSPKSGA